jgi:tripartite-type tricarboxylate transporter receptor subunit TctC
MMTSQARARRVSQAAAVVLFACVAGAAPAAGWMPSDRINLVTHSSPGTGNELMLREIAEVWMKDKLVPKAVSVESVTGAQGEKARRYVITQNRGNAHMLTAYTPQSLNVPLLIGSDTGWRQFAPVAMMAFDPLVLVANAAGPYPTLKALIDAAHRQPRQVMQGGGNYGNSASLAGKLLEEGTGSSFSYVPFKGGGDAVLALLGNHVSFIIENPAEVLEHIKAGKLKAIAVSDHLALFPDVPTIAEAGYKVRVLKQFRALMAPPGAAPDVVAGYVALLDRTRRTPEWQAYLRRTALTDGWMTGPQLAAFYAEEEKEYERLDDAMHLKRKKK